MQTYSLFLREKHRSRLSETVEEYLDLNERQLAGRCGYFHLHLFKVICLTLSRQISLKETQFVPRNKHSPRRL